MKVRLNLATKPFETNRSFALGAALVGGLGVLAMLVLSWHAFRVWRANTEMRAEQVKIETDMNHLRAERADVESFFNQTATVQQQDRAAFLNSLIGQRAFPWTNIF